MKTTSYTEIFINGVSKETEKAICLNCEVSWNANIYARDIWFPKSTVKHVGERLAEVATWILNKNEREHAFHGYEMRFETATIFGE